MKKLLIAIIAIGAFMALGYWEHHYTREQCEVVRTTADSTIFKDKQGHLWESKETGFTVGEMVDLKMHDNFTVSDIKDDTIRRIIKTSSVAFAETEEETAVVFEEETPPKTLKSIGTYTITAYCPCRKCCGKWANGITASGVTAKANHTIAAPKNIPFGTILIIDGIEYTVEDRGGAIKGKRLDLFMENHETCLQWGKQKKEVFVYE